MFELADHAVAVELHHESVEAFVEPQPVLYLAPAASRSLRALHERFVDLLDARAWSWLTAYYRPDHWQPHCTVAMEFDPARLDEASALLRDQFSPLTAACEGLQLIEFRPVEVLARRAFGGRRSAQQT